jgi:hypothetical protein
MLEGPGPVTICITYHIASVDISVAEPRLGTRHKNINKINKHCYNLKVHTNTSLHNEMKNIILCCLKICTTSTVVMMHNILELNHHNIKLPLKSHAPPSPTN